MLSNILTLILCVALQLEVEVSRQRHDGDLKEKNRMARMLENKVSWFLTDWSSPDISGNLLVSVCVHLHFWPLCWHASFPLMFVRCFSS